jgi:hypothetical protein
MAVKAKIRTTPRFWEEVVSRRREIVMLYGEGFKQR